MSVNTYLSDSASNLVLSTKEKESITTSINTLEIRLESYFGANIEEKFKFVCSVFENKIGNISAIAKASEHQRFMNETPGAKRAIKKLANEFLNSYETEVKK